SLVHTIAGKELAVIKANAIVQKQFNVRRDKHLAVFVDAALQFKLNSRKAIKNDFSFPLGHVEGFIGCVRKERVIIHLAAKRSAIDEVSMKQQGKSFWLIPFLTIRPKYLSRSHEDERSLLVIVFADAILKVATFDVFQEHRVETKVHPPHLPGCRFGKIDDAYERVQGLIPVEGAELSDSVKFQYLFHGVPLFTSKSTRGYSIAHSDGAGSVKLVGKPVICIRLPARL